MGKNKKGLMVAFLVLFLLLGVYFLLKSLNLEEEPETANAVKTVFEMNAEDISEIQIEYDGNSYTFSHGDDKWSYEEDELFPLSEAAVLDIVSGVTSVEASRELDDPGELSEYGLDNPVVQVRVKDTGGKEVLLKFGNDNESLGSSYMKKDEEKTVYLVDSSVKEKFCRDISDLAEKEEIPSISSSTIQKVEITQEKNTKSIEKDESAETGWTYKVADNGKEILSEAVDGSKVNSFMNNYTGLAWQEFVSYDLQDLTKYGLDNPIAITINYQVTETEETDESEEAEEKEETKVDKQEIFYIGNQDENGNYYAMLEGGNYVYKLSASSVKLMLSLDIDSLASSLVADYSFADLDKVTFIRNNQTYVASKKTDDSEEQKYYLNDKEIDKTLFSDFYSEVTSMEWQTRETQVKTENNSPDMMVTFEKEGGLNVTVNYYPYDSNFYLVIDSKGNTVLVNKMKVKQMLESFDAMVEEWNQ